MPFRWPDDRGPVIGISLEELTGIKVRSWVRRARLWNRLRSCDVCAHAHHNEWQSAELAFCDGIALTATSTAKMMLRRTDRDLRLCKKHGIRIALLIEQLMQ